jgi:hypothetical protein
LVTALEAGMEDDSMIHFFSTNRDAAEVWE